MLVCFATLWLSGAALLIWTNAGPLRWAHLAASVALGVLLGWHAAWRWRAATALRSPRLIPFAFAAVAASAIGLAWWATASPGVAQTASAAAGTAQIAHASIKPGTLPSAEACAGCHGDISAEWRGSAHANALNDAYYLGLAGMFAQERGAEALRYCAGCHNPVGLMQGEIDLRLAQKNQPGSNAYEVRGLGVNLPVSARAAEGVSCALCHRAFSADPAGAGLLINTTPLALPQDAQGRLELQAAPAPHRAEVWPAILQQAELCGACHNLRTPDGLLLEPTFDEWRASRFAAEGVTCQDCHMPRASARKVDSALPSLVHAHGGQPGAPSSLAGLDAGGDLLARAASVQVFAGADIITVTVVNTGTGHFLPSGADDLREVWLDVSAFDASGAVVWQTGELDRFGALPADAVRFGKVLGDARGQPIALHRFWQATQILKDTRLAPGQARALTFANTSRVTRVLARLRYRDVSPAFAEVTLNQPARVAVREIVMNEFIVLKQ